MILVWLLVIPMLGGLFAWMLEKRNPGAARWSALFTLSLNSLIIGVFAVGVYGRIRITPGPWLASIDAAWIPAFGIHFHLAMDGLSLVLVLLTHFLGLVAVASSWTEIKERTGFFFFNLMWVIAGIMGVFLALDLFLFYFFWEMMLIPMFFMIIIWGHENRIYAGIKFFLFTQVSGLLMLAAILGLYCVHGLNTGHYTFNYLDLLGAPIPAKISGWLMAGFLIAFCVKLPVVPVHTWLPDAHTEAPTAGSIILAGLLLKTGAYGILRFVAPLFPDASRAFAPYAMILSVVAILYGAWLALSQTDLKRMVAYTSVSHMGFVLLGIFAWNTLALQGAVIQIICHGISTGALFFLVGALQERIHSRDINRMGGFWACAPKMGGIALLFSLASLGLPGLGNFVGEFLILLGAYAVNQIMTILAALGLILAAVYSLWLIQAAFYGPAKEIKTIADLTVREIIALGAMIIAIIWLGLYPQPVFKTTGAALEHLESLTSPATPAENEIMMVYGRMPGANPAIQKNRQEAKYESD
jgi:NADH-quinone oxidoreductase subunit M